MENALRKYNRVMEEKMWSAKIWRKSITDTEHKCRVLTGETADELCIVNPPQRTLIDFREINQK